MKSQTALGQLSRFYDLPTFGHAGASDSSAVDFQCGMEMMWSILISAQAGLNLCHDVGYLGSGLLFSIGSLLLGDEVISAVSHFMGGIEVHKETLALDVINKVGPEGNFLSEETTIKFLKQEGWYPGLLNRKQLQVWKAEGSKTVNQRLEEEVYKLIEADVPPLISDDEIKEIDKIIADREKNLA